MSIDLRLLRYLVATVDAGSATAAAAALHVTQPVLSRQLRKLEHDLGLRLFERDGRRLRLTHAAEDFLPRARAVLRDADALLDASRALASGRLEELHVAVPTTTLTDVLAPFIATLEPSDPVPLLRSLDPGGAAPAIAAGADVAIVHRPPSRSLASLPLAVLPVLAYVRADDEWAARGAVRLRELIERPLVLLSDDFRPRQLLDVALDREGLAYGTVVECTNAQVAQALAAAGRGVAVVSDDPRFDLVPLGITGPGGAVRISLYAAWDPRHHAAAVIEDFARRLAGFIVERYGAAVAASR